MTEIRKSVAELSERLLDETELVQRLERLKRETPMSSPDFEWLADEIRRHAEHVAEVAAGYDAAAHEAPKDEQTIEDIARREETSPPE